MADVFISYSRRDKDFVRDLHEALAKRERDTWVDWEDIPLTAEWLAEIHAGIEGADAFVFVISPDSAGSKVCREELAHAVEHNKRLVPIVRRDVDAESVPQPLGAYNWIFFRDGDDFDEAFQSLLDAIDTDLDWVREHTRLLERAVEWDRRGRDNSFVLRGSDLRTAEEWQARAAERDPKPTPLQTEYVLASRNSATRRQRITLGGVTIGLVVAIALGVVAWVQRGEAIRQSNIAVGRQLAAQAQLREDQAPQFLQQSVLLALEAERQSPLPSLEAEQILRRGLALLPRPVAGFTYEDEADLTELTYGASSRLGGVVFSPDGRYLAATNAGRTARVWDPANDREITTVTHGDEIQDIAFSSDGEYLATAGADNTARVWDTSSGEEISRLNHAGIVSEVLFRPDGEYLATASADKTVRLWDPVSGSEVARADQDQAALGIAFSPDGEYLAIAISTAVRLWDPDSGKEIARLDYDEGSPTSLAFSPDGEYLAAASGFSAGSGARVWNLADREEVARVSPQVAISDIAFSRDSRYLATAGGDRTARLWDIVTGEEIARVDHGDLVASVDFSPDGDYLATASYDNTARVWDLTSGGEEVARAIHEDTVKDAVFGPDGKYLATASADNTARVWDPYSTREFVNMAHENAHAFAVSRDGKYLVTAGSDATARVWDPRSGEEVARMTHGFNVVDVAFSPESKYLATVGVDNTARVWEVGSGEEVARIPHEDVLMGVAFHPDGEYLATVGFDAVARVWDPESGEEVARMTPEDAVEGISFAVGGDYLSFGRGGRYLATVAGRGVSVWETGSGDELAHVAHRMSVNDVAFSPDGDLLATASSDQTARVWDLGSGEEAARINHVSNVVDVAFSPGGRYLATASVDNTVGVWDPESGEEVARMTHDLPVSRVAFSPDGRYVATASADKTARVWDPESGSEIMRLTHGPYDNMVDVAFGGEGDYIVTFGTLSTRAWLWRRPEDLVEEACTRLTRNFTEAEWQQNLPGEDYRETCPNLPGPEGVGEGAV